MSIFGSLATGVRSGYNAVFRSGDLVNESSSHSQGGQEEVEDPNLVVAEIGKNILENGSRMKGDRTKRKENLAYFNEQWKNQSLLSSSQGNTHFNEKPITDIRLIPAKHETSATTNEFVDVDPNQFDLKSKPHSHLSELFNFSKLTVVEKIFKGLKLFFLWIYLIPYALYQDHCTKTS